MRKYYEKVKLLVFSNTAKDTYVLFIGNILAAFWGFLFTLFVARALSVPDFGIFSAALNLVAIITSLADLGISTGSVSFIAESVSKGDLEKANKYIKSSLVIRLLVVIGISLLVILFAPLVAPSLLATSDYKIAIWSAIVPIFLFPDMFFPPVLQAKGSFFQSTLITNIFYIVRLLFAFLFFVIGRLDIGLAFWAFGASFLVELLLAFYFLKTKFLYSNPGKNEYHNLLRFSGWIGVNRIVSSVSGRLDIQMLAAMVGASATGIYSIPARLASFIVVLAGSFSSVLATRMASFGNKDKEKIYLIKSTIALIPVSLGLVVWIIFGKEFLLLLFGQKYLSAVPVFKYLVAAQIPFLFTAPPVTAIIYSMKKTVYIGVLSFFQLAAIFMLNYYFIPKYGPIGPTLTIGITNLLLAIYVWFLVVRYYWR